MLSLFSFHFSLSLSSLPLSLSLSLFLSSLSPSFLSPLPLLSLVSSPFLPHSFLLSRSQLIFLFSTLIIVAPKLHSLSPGHASLLSFHPLSPSCSTHKVASYFFRTTEQTKKKKKKKRVQSIRSKGKGQKITCVHR
ncbi:MAG: hypothetical protein J3R72DRAFT_165260 [Linnemannia gamsii]|nr:MAG: hypothetical protein J3R72DRAFT_165260 [Linnemannia gamsii]